MKRIWGALLLLVLCLLVGGCGPLLPIACGPVPSGASTTTTLYTPASSTTTTTTASSPSTTGPPPSTTSTTSAPSTTTTTEAEPSVAILDVQRKVLYPARFKAYSAGAPEYIQFWLEEGVCTQDRGNAALQALYDAGYTDGVAGYWNVAAENDYVDWNFAVPPGGFALPAGDYVVALPILVLSNGDKCGITVSYRCDAGAHVDSASEVFCDAITVAFNQNFLLIPLTVTAYTATSAASINIKCTSDDGFSEGNIYIWAWNWSEVAGAYGLVGPCLGLDTTEADLEGWTREPPSIIVASPPASSHQAPALIAGTPSFQMQVEGVYPTDVLEVCKYSDANRADPHVAGDARPQFEHLAVEAITTSAGTADAVSKVLTVATGFSPSAGVYKMAPPDACRNRAPAATVWAPSTVYAAGALVVPTYSNEHYYEAQDPGTSGSTEPLWPTDGTTVADNTVAAWEDQGEQYEYDVNTYFALKVRDRYPFAMIVKCGDEAGYKPVAYWRLGEASGTVCADEMGTLDLAYTNGPTLGATGLLTNDDDTCVQFDGSNDAAFSSTPLWAAGSWPDTFTIEMLFKDTVPSDATYRWLLLIGDGANDYVEILAGNNAAQTLWFRGKDNSVAWGCTKTSAYTANATHHLVCTRDGATSKIWVDGVDLGAGASTGARTVTGTGISWTANAFEGYIDEVAVYDRILTDEEIEGHYRASIIGSEVIATVGIETLLDLNSPLSVGTTVDPPTLTAVPDTDSKTLVTLEWTPPASWTDPQPLGWEVKVAMADGEIIQKVVGTHDFYELGYVSAGTYSWTARTIDPWGSVSDWQYADTFVVSQAGTLPQCILEPLPRTIYSQPMTRWGWTDVDGDVQTAYEIEIDDSPGFGSPAYDSGTVVSAVLFYQHSGLANGTWYRRVRVRTGAADWSAWEVDSFILANPTSQSSVLELYRVHPESTPGNLVRSKIHVPITSPVGNRIYSGTGGFSFVMNNFPPFVERSIVSCHHFDELSGAIAHDIFGPYDLALTGSPAWTSYVLNLAGDDYGVSPDLALALGGDWTIEFVLKATGSSGCLVFLGRSTDDANYVHVSYNGSGIIRIERNGAQSANLTVGTTLWKFLRLKKAGTTCTLTDLSGTAGGVTLTSVSATGTPRLAVGRRMSATPASTANSGLLAGLKVHSDDLTAAEDARDLEAYRQTLVHRGVSI